MARIVEWMTPPQNTDNIHENPMSQLVRQIMKDSTRILKTSHYSDQNGRRVFLDWVLIVREDSVRWTWEYGYFADGDPLRSLLHTWFQISYTWERRLWCHHQNAGEYFWRLYETLSRLLDFLLSPKMIERLIPVSIDPKFELYSTYVYILWRDAMYIREAIKVFDMEKAYQKYQELCTFLDSRKFPHPNENRETTIYRYFIEKKLGIESLWEKIREISITLEMLKLALEYAWRYWKWN